MFFMKTLETKGLFQFESIINVFPIQLNVMGLRPLEIFNFFQCGDRLYTSESDVCKIITYKDGPRAERVKALTAIIVVFNLFY